MPELILDPDYWRRRMETAPPSEPHHAIFRCPLDRWLRIEAKHREILSRVLDIDERILDAGCGWGRLIDLLPTPGRFLYRGIDLSPTFVERAEQLHPGYSFVVGDLRRVHEQWGWEGLFTTAVRPTHKTHYHKFDKE